MAKVSVIIPSRNERFLPQTIDDVFRKARGDVEVLPILDGYWPSPPLQDRPNLVIIHKGAAQGMRAAINSAAAISHGKFILKCDAHCMFAEGYDIALSENCDDDWIAIPSRYSLDPEKWAILQTGKSRIDYHYLSYPYPPNMTSDCGLHGVPWNERARQRFGKPEYDIDDEMSFQGSCWFMSRKHWDRLGGLSEEIYGTFMGEPQEIGLRTWLGGGRCVTNKKTYYAHLHKGKVYGRGYPFPHGERDRYSTAGSRYWMTNSWKERKHDLQWLIEKFWPVPTWPNDIFEKWDTYVAEHITP